MYEDSNSVPWKGLLGALIGVIPGVFLWALLGSFGITWAMIGALIVIGAVFLYTLFGGDTDNKYGLIGCLIICLAGVYFGVHLAWSARLSYALKQAGVDYSLSHCAFNLFELLDLAELKGKYFFAVLKGYLFAGAGGYGYFAKFGNH